MPGREITYELKVIETTGGKEKIIYIHRPTISATNREHLYNLMLIAFEVIKKKFENKEL